MNRMGRILWGSAVSVGLLCAGCIPGTDKPGRATQVEMVRKAVAALSPAPGQLKVLCDWNLGADASGYNCDAYRLVTDAAPSDQEARWWRDARLLVATSIVAIGSWHGKDDVAVNKVFLASVDPSGDLGIYVYRCTDSSLEPSLNFAPVVVPDTAIAAGGCRLVLVHGDPTNVSDALAGP
jgi:hypothetical protein